MAKTATAVAVLFVMLFAGSAAAAPLPADSPPSIGSDKADYAPGSAVTLTGTYWQPGESVHITVNDDQGMTWSRDTDVTADADGGIQDQFTLPNWFVATYSVKATGSSGSVATSSFTDGNLNFALATAGQSAPLTISWSTTWKHYSGSSCATEDGSGTANYSGSTFASGNQPAVGNNQSAQPTGASATGYVLDYWSNSATSTTPLTPAQLCAAGPNSTDLYAHLKPAQQAQTISFTAPTNVTYGDADVDPGATASSGLPVTYTSSTASVCTIVSGKVHVVAAGNCTVTASQAGNASYSAAQSVSRTFAIGKAVLSVNAADKSKVYGDANPALSSTLSGFKNSDTQASVNPTGAADCSIATGTGPTAGSYANAITCAPGTLAATNYTFATGTKGTLTITKASVTAKADDKSKVYGDGNPTLTGTLSGVKNGDAVSDSYTTAASNQSGIGDYTISAHVNGTAA
ncbi:MAG: hypothetical protein QOK21_79, partial [Solirubrobacteraceae bacterium]|nr:hypothetical protein [Solirubrobacteraceae bacterium]